MNSTAECLLGGKFNTFPITLPLRIYSGVYASLLLLLAIGSASLWVTKRKSLVYLEKRSLPAVLIITLSLVTNVYVSPWIRTKKSLSEVNISCVGWNIMYASVAPLAILGSLVNVANFKCKEVYTSAVAKHKGEEQIQYWIKLLNTSYFTNILLFLLVSVLFFIILLSAMFSCKGKDCIYYTAFESKSLFIVVIFYVVAAFEVIYLYFQMKSYPDPFDLLGSTFRAYVGTLLLAVVILPLASIYDSLYLGDKNQIDFIGGVLRDLIFCFFFIYLVPLQIYKAYKFDLQGALYEEFTLEKVLNDRTGHDLFKEYLVSEFSVENIIFLDAVKKLRLEDKARERDSAHRLFTALIQRRCINLSSEVYEVLFALKESGKLNATSFDDAVDEITDFLRFDSFPRFKASKQFRQYIGSI